MDITFLGDIYMPERVESRLALNCVVVLNLEYPITKFERGYPGKINIKAEANYLRDAFGDRTIIANLANNHIIDYRERGFQDTLESLKEENIYFFGAGYKKDNFDNPILVEINDLSVAFIGYADESSSPVYGAENKPGASKLKFETVKRDILKAKDEGAEYIVTSLHWGAQDVKLPIPKHQQLAHKIIELGADLIIGHHAHCMQPIEWYKDKLICYGMGNTIFPDTRMAHNYDEAGRSSSYTYKKQEWWNKESLIVHYNLIHNTFKFDKSWFENGICRTIKKNYKPSRLKKDISTTKFRFYFFKSKFRQILYAFYRNPKMVKKEHFRGLYNILFTSRFK